MNIPPVRLLDANFRDLEHMCASVRSWDLNFHPLSGAAHEKNVGRIVVTQCDGYQIGYARLAASIEQLGAPPPGSLTFVVPEQRLKRLWWRGHDVDPGTVLLFPVGSELHCISGPDFEVHTVSASEQTVALICEDLKLNLPDPPKRPEVFRLPVPVLDACRTALRTISDHLYARATADARAVLERLVKAWVWSENTRFRDSGSVRARDRAVRTCLERFQEEGWYELSSSQLCRIAGVSERTLQYAFRERFGLTPAAFLKARRLAGVRRVLSKSASSGLKIGDAMAEFGFWHVGQFAADYRAAFGEIPSVTLKRAATVGYIPGFRLAWDPTGRGAGNIRH